MPADHDLLHQPALREVDPAPAAGEDLRVCGRPSQPVAPAGPQARLDQVRRELESIHDNTLFGLAVIRTGRIDTINARGAAILGRDPQELAGVAAALLFPSTREYERFLDASHRVHGAAAPAVTEGRLLHRDGRTVWVRLQAKPLAAAPQDATHLWIFDDISEQKQLEEALRASKQTAEAASAAKSQLLANMSHELRTPLNGILGLTQLLLDSEVSGEPREYLSIIRQSAGVLLHVLGDLLDLSNVETGRLTVEAREFDLQGEFEPLLRNFAAQSQLRAFTFSRHIDASLPRRLVGDPDRTRQICIHLLGNAFKYTRQGTVRASIERDDRPDNPVLPGRVRLRFQVADTGIGIEPDRQQAVFEPFGIGEDYLTKKYSGAGLGLAIAKRLAQIMGGDIDLESTPGQGSIFTLSLDFGLPVAPVANTSLPAPPPPPAGRTLRILLAEDEAVNRLFTARTLQKLGHEVETVNDGQEALDRLAKARFDLVLMDIQMPRLNGLDATRCIRSGQVPGVSPRLPVVALTAYAMDSDRVRGIEAGMDAYLAKPFEPEALLRAIDRALARQA